MSRYAAIWTAIKTANKLPDTKDRKVSVVVNRDHAQATESGLKKLKSNENVGLRNIGQVGWSKLVIERDDVPDNPHMIRLTFSLLYSTDL